MSAEKASSPAARSKRSGAPTLSRVLLDVAQVLQSPTDFGLRLLRTFELIGELVPYTRCALLEAPAGAKPFLVVLPELLPDAHAIQNDILVEHFSRLALGRQTEWRGSTGPTEPYLAVPLMGLDEVIGVLHVSRRGDAYTQRHWRALSLIGAQLGAYLKMLRAGAAALVHGRALEEAQRSAAEAIRERDELRARTQGDNLPLAGISVLLVDDDFDIRDAFRMVLEQSGAMVWVAESAAAALTMLATWRPDVLLSDLSMPGQSGYELMRRVATRVDAPPAAAMTAHATKEGRERALAAGFRLYLGKPLESAELVETVAVLAGRRLAASPFPLH